MWIFGFLILLIVSQVAVGGLVVAAVSCALLRWWRCARRRRVRLAETARASLHTAAAAVPAATLSWAAAWIVGATSLERSPAGLWVPLVLGAFCGGLCAMACLFIVAAGRIESRGRRRRSARRVDTAGRLMFLASAGYAAVLFGATVLSTSKTRGEWLPGPWSPGLLALSATLLGLAGFLGLLAGLSRKPRPSGSFAALIYVASQWALLYALGL